MNYLPKKTDKDKEWDGFTLDELRYERAYAAAKTEISKEKFYAALNNVTNGGKKAGLLQTVMGGLSYFDYGVIAFRLGSKVFNLFRSLRGLRRRR